MCLLFFSFRFSYTVFPVQSVFCTRYIYYCKHAKNVRQSYKLKERNTQYQCFLLFLLYKFFSHLCRRLHQQFESYKEQVRKIGEEARRYQGEHKDDAPTCGICHKTKFADGCGHLCSYCRTKFCARCGGRVSLRSNNVSLLMCTLRKSFLDIVTLQIVHLKFGISCFILLKCFIHHFIMRCV